MQEILTFTADGVPAPQGSKNTTAQKDRAGAYTGKVSVYESSAKLKPWRQVVVNAARAADPGPPTEGPLILNIVFRLPRPKDHFGTGRNAGKLKPSAPEWPTKKPDVDKLERAILDALTIAKVYRDDSQVVVVNSAKVFADERPPGVMVSLETFDDRPPASAQRAASA